MLLGATGVCCAVLAGMDLAVLALSSGRNLDEIAPTSVVQALVTLLPVLKVALFVPGTTSTFPFIMNALFCGAGAALTVVAGTLVARRRPVGSLLAALLGPCLLGLTLFVSVVRLAMARDGGSWYESVNTVFIGLAVLSFVAGLAMIPPHREQCAHSGPDAHAFARRVFTGSALGLAAVYALYLVGWYLLEWYDVWEPPIPVVILAALVSVVLVVLGRVVTRRCASKGVLIAGGLAAMPFTLLLLGLLTPTIFITSLFVPQMITALCATVPLITALTRLVAEPAPEGGASAAPGPEGGASAALITAAIWAGPIITGLGVVGIDEARRIAYEDARLKGEETIGYPEIGDTFLDTAAGSVRTYAMLFALAAVGLTLLARWVRKRGGTPGTQTVAFVSAVAYLVLLTTVSTLTPFIVGDSDEPVHIVVVQGPLWYVPAVRTIVVCSAMALVAALFLLIRRPGRRAEASASRGSG
ncbi:hypothetical protein ABZ897_07060 [Nonomuraea sp. NPDC046802]|uniref:hypothetical protein n=1 Tax=Nonomuraea sp. NPDC046802 TaxID=3154919 RepID=UPI0033D9FDE6